MTKLAPRPIYGKNLKKSSSPEPIDRWPWNLVCSIVYASTTTVGIDLDLFYTKVNFGHIGFCIHKSENYVLFLYYCSHRPQSWFIYSDKWVNEVKWVSEVKVIVWPWPKVTQISKLKLVFCRNYWVIWNQISYESLWLNGNEIYTNE